MKIYFLISIFLLLTFNSFSQSKKETIKYISTIFEMLNFTEEKINNNLNYRKKYDMSIDFYSNYLIINKNNIDTNFEVDFDISSNKIENKRVERVSYLINLKELSIIYLDSEHLNVGNNKFIIQNDRNICVYFNRSNSEIKDLIDGKLIENHLIICGNEWDFYFNNNSDLFEKFKKSIYNLASMLGNKVSDSSY